MASAPSSNSTHLGPAGSRVDQIANGAATVLPVMALGLVGWQLWDGLLHWQDLAILVFMVTILGLGITVGFHRLFTHRSFQTTRPMRALFGILGSAALEGPVIEWVAYHRRHHQFSDQEGDPHSPHVGHGEGFFGALRGLWYAHVGWVWFSSEPAEEEHYAKDLLADRVTRLVDRTFLVWVLAGIAIPFGLGVALTGTVAGGLTGALWGGAVRICVGHHITFSINSLCHFFGRQRYATGDESRNLAWLAVPTFGEAWHNNHHAFPTAARHGVGRKEVDPSGMLIAGMERLGLIWDVVRISPERRDAKLAAARA